MDKLSAHNIKIDKLTRAISNLAGAGVNSSTIIFQVVDFVLPRAIQHSLLHGDYSYIQSLYKTIKDICPNRADAFILYLITIGPFKITQQGSAVVFDDSLVISNHHESFKTWVTRNKLAISMFKQKIEASEEFIQIIENGIKVESEEFMQFIDITKTGSSQ